MSAEADCAPSDSADGSRGGAPDLSDPRYLDEVGYFLYYEKEMRWDFADYAEERRSYSQLHLEEVLAFVEKDSEWMRDQRVVNIGAGCSCAVLAWPCRSKFSVDPLLDVYSRLGMLLPDEEGSGDTVFLTASAEALPLLSAETDLVYCRNALDHMHHPERAVLEMARILRPGGRVFLDADLEGDPTPDEPSSLTEQEILEWVAPWFETRKKEHFEKPFSIHSRGRLRILLERNDLPVMPAIKKESVYRDYLKRIEETKT